MTPSPTVIGYHVWQLKTDGYLWSIGGNSPDRWEPGAWLRARCADPFPPNRHPSGGPVPHPDCTCGIHLPWALPDLDSGWILTLKPDKILVFGRAEGTGQREVALDTDLTYVPPRVAGWRVELARPTELLFARPKTDLTATAQLYAVPLRPFMAH